ncbi:MAG: MMPL family transporter [Spirochaetota bacterium]|nr:MMPL family transporter [Spirochaetota bacterium]
MTNSDSLIEIIISRYKHILLGILIITIPLFYYFLQQKHVNQIDIYFDEDSPELLFYKRFQETYGNEELLAIAFSEEDIFTKANIDIIRSITNTIKGIDGVQRVFSLTEVEEAVGYDDTISFKKIIPEEMIAENKLHEIRDDVLENNLLINSLISRDGGTTAILAEIQPLIQKEKREVLKNIVRTIDHICSDKVEIHYTGIPYTELEMSKLSIRDFITFTPIILLCIFIIITIMLKNFSLSILSQFNLLVIFVWGIGFFIFCGESFNIVTIIMGAILLAIAIADTIHLLSHYKDNYQIIDNDHSLIVENTVKQIWLPCFYTSITTAIGFFSFILSSIRPVKILGVFTSISVLIAFFITMTFLPAMLLIFHKNNWLNTLEDKAFKPSNNNNNSPLMKIFWVIGSFVINHDRIIGISTIVIIGLSIIGISKIKFETNTINYLPEKNKLRMDVEFIDNKLGGTIPFAMLIQAKSSDCDFTHPASLNLINDIQNYMMSNIVHFSTSFSIADYCKEINRAFNNGNEKYYRIPKERSDIVDFYEIGDSEILDRVIAPDFMEARISFQSVWDTNETASRYEKLIFDYLTAKLGQNFSYKMTGLSSLYLTMEENLKYSQIKSFLLAFVLIFIMMFFVCKTISLTVISMIANIFPIASILGIMGWYNIPMDVSTIMIASVTLGIAVDDTIHFLTWFKRNMSTRGEIKSALLNTYKDVGKPIVITSLVLFLGFFILILGSLKPTHFFGVLTAFAMLLALIGDLVILPSLLIIFKPKIQLKNQLKISSH